MSRPGALWRTLSENPATMRRISGMLIICSVIEWTFAGVTGLVNSVAYVSHLSQLTFTISLIPWWQGTKIEARQAEEDIPNDVVEKLVEHTNIDKA